MLNIDIYSFITINTSSSLKQKALLKFNFSPLYEINGPFIIFSHSEFLYYGL